MRLFQKFKNITDVGKRVWFQATDPCRHNVAIILIKGQTNQTNAYRMTHTTRKALQLPETISKALEATLVEGHATGNFFENREIVKGYDFDKGLDYHEIFKSFMNNGFQSTLFAKAVNEVNAMVSYL